MSDSRNYLHPEALKRIARLELRAEHVVEGFLSGAHRSPYFGQSVEFRQHRPYVPGDDLRHVDWQVWARQDRLYVKQFEEDTNLRVNLLVDVSDSMSYGRGGDAMTKADYAATIAASLAYLVLKHQDAIGCLTFDQTVRSRLAPLSRRTQLQAVVRDLQQQQPAHKTDLLGIFRDAAQTYPQRGMFVVISDLFGDPESTLKGLRLLRQRGHDVLVFQVLDDDEIDFPFSGSSRFEDLESDATLDCRPEALREGYLDELHGFLNRIRHGCAAASIDAMLVRTGDPLDAVLAEFLSRRMARSRGS